VSEADHGRIPLTKETFGGLLTRWLDHIEIRGRAPKTLVENRRMAAAITVELGAKGPAEAQGVGPRRLLRPAESPRFVGDQRPSVSRGSAALNQGVRWGLLERSPAAQASPPSMERNEPDAPSPEQIKLLIERAEEKDPELATLLFVAATTGCRRGELCGLRWSGVDFEKDALLVRRSVSDLPGRVEIRSTKTGHIRKMALDSVTALRARATPGAGGRSLGRPGRFARSGRVPLVLVAGRVVTAPSG
jgi:integrase